MMNTMTEEQLIKAVMYIWHLAYDTGLRDGYGRNTKELELKKRPPPDGRELAKEGGLIKC